METIDIAVIGGTASIDPAFLKNIRDVKAHTPYGLHSDILIGEFDGKNIAILARHNKDHSLPPHKINFRANIFALKQLGVKQAIGVGTCGSLKEEFKPGELAIIDQFINTFAEKFSFYDGPEVYHVSMAEPFCPTLRQLCIDACKRLKIPHQPKGTFIRISGPQFSTRAESKLYRNFADVIGMTGLPEAILCRELGICYALIACVTDYDVWAEKAVEMTDIVKVMASNISNVQKVLGDVLPKLPNQMVCSCSKALENAKVL